MAQKHGLLSGGMQGLLRSLPPLALVPPVFGNLLRRLVQPILISRKANQFNRRKPFGSVRGGIAQRGLPAGKEKVVIRQLNGLIDRVYGLKPSHDVDHEGRQARGFRGLSLKAQPKPAKDHSPGKAPNVVRPKVILEDDPEQPGAAAAA